VDRPPADLAGVDLRLRTAHGFTLIEVLVALTILLVGLTGNRFARQHGQRPDDRLEGP
jgi:prepilin-type N-terminal cleavage/methylation domain-containing protein